MVVSWFYSLRSCLPENCLGCESRCGPSGRRTAKAWVRGRGRTSARRPMKTPPPSAWRGLFSKPSGRRRWWCRPHWRCHPGTASGISFSETTLSTMMEKGMFSIMNIVYCLARRSVQQTVLTKIWDTSFVICALCYVCNIYWLLRLFKRWLLSFVYK